MSESYLNVNEVKKYLDCGGYPECIKQTSAKNYLRQLIQDIIQHDIRARFALKKHYLLEDLLALILRSCTSPISASKLANVLKTTTDTVLEYIYYFEKCFLIEQLPVFSWSENERIYNAKKIYPCDPAFLGLVNAHPSLGQRAEVAVYQILSQQSKLGYLKVNGQEIDFAYGEYKAISLVESKFDNGLSPEHDKLKPIYKALKQDTDAHLKHVSIITNDQEESWQYKGVNIELIPLWRYLLDLE